MSRATHTRTDLIKTFTKLETEIKSENKKAYLTIFLESGVSSDENYIDGENVTAVNCDLVDIDGRTLPCLNFTTGGGKAMLLSDIRAYIKQLPINNTSPIALQFNDEDTFVEYDYEVFDGDTFWNVTV